MSTKEELENLGYALSFSQECPIKAWGKWYCTFKKDKGPIVSGYGDSEEAALEEALKSARKIEVVLDKNLNNTP